jgi:hypothetical protein
LSNRLVAMAALALSGLFCFVCFLPPHPRSCSSTSFLPFCQFQP